MSGMPGLSRVELALRWLLPTAVLAALTSHFWFPDLPSGATHDTYSVAAEGQKAFLEVVVNSPDCLGAWRTQQPLSEISNWADTDLTLCILGPARSPTPEEWTAMMSWVSSGGRLLYAFRGDKAEEIDTLNIRYRPYTSAIDDTLPPHTRLANSQQIAWWSDGYLIAPEANSLVTYDGQLQAVTQSLGSGQVVVVASRLPFSNQLLTYRDNGLLAYRLLAAAGSAEWVAFDESLNVSGTPQVVQLLLDPAIRPATLQLIVLAFFYAWWNSRRFGPGERTAPAARQSVIEHTNAIGNWIWRTQEGGRVVKRYLRTVSRQLHRLGSETRGPQQTLDELCRRLASEDAELGRALQTLRDDLPKPKMSRQTAAKHLKTLMAARQRLPQRPF